MPRMSRARRGSPSPVAPHPYRADTVALQEHHDLANGLLLAPAGRNAAKTRPTDALDLEQAMRGGRVGYAMAIGCRDREANAEMRLDSIFRIASITKPMVSVAATQLTEEGRREPFADRAAIWASE